MHRLLVCCLLPLVLFVETMRAQSFGSNPVAFSPDILVEFKMNLPISHLDINDYAPSTRGVYVGQNVTFRFYGRNAPWTNPGLFMRVRWDDDMDASNGVTWSDWFEDEHENAFATVVKNFSKPGIYTLTFEIEFFETQGQQVYSRQKQYDITAVPVPTSVFQDGRGNRLFFWVGSDLRLDRPTFLVEGFDPDSSNTPAVNYSVGFDLIEEARSRGFDVFIMDWANGGGDIVSNKDVFLGACKFIHDQLHGKEAAIQVVGVSMGGVIARYGLAWAEDESPQAHPSQFIYHYVNTFISFDAPQQGAHLNSGIQRVITENGSSTQQSVLQSPAARQMLYKDLYDASQNEHASFYSALNSLHNEDPSVGHTNGYPRQSRNFSISNGNRTTIYPGKTTSDDLGLITIYGNVSILSIATIPVVKFTRHITVENRDVWPGSTFAEDLTRLSTQGFKDIVDDGLGGALFRAGGGWRFRVYFNPGYTPTESALDLDGFSRISDGSLVGGNSWFDDTLAQTSTHKHIELTGDSKSKIMQWLRENLGRPYLGRPSNLSASNPSFKEVTITFTDEAAFEQGFKVERKTANGPYEEIASLGPNSVQFADFCVDPATTYTYRIRAFSGNRYSPYSSELSVTTPMTCNLAAPSNVVAREDPSSISLSWHAVAGATSYKVYRTSPGESCPSFAAVTPSVSFIDYVPLLQQKYAYQVTALNGTEEGVPSDVLHAQGLHMAASTTSALSSNGQYKLADANISYAPTRALVFESGNGAYVSTWEPTLKDWIREERLGGSPDDPNVSRNPSLAQNPNNRYLDIFNESVNLSTRDHVIQHTLYPDRINAPIVVDLIPNLDTRFELLPVGAWSPSGSTTPAVLAAAWRNGASISVGLGETVNSTGVWRWTTDNLYPKFIDKMASPSTLSIAVDLQPAVKPQYVIYLVYSDPRPSPDGGIKLIRGTLYPDPWPPDAVKINWDNNTIYSIAGNSPTAVNSKPVIAIDGSSNVTIAWEFLDSSNPSSPVSEIRVQKRSGQCITTVLNPTVTVGAGLGVSAPSVTAYRYSSLKADDLTLLWSTSSGIMCAQYRSRCWGNSYLVDPGGTSPNIIVPLSSSDERSFIDLSASGPPFSLQVKDLNSAPPPPSAPTLSYSDFGRTYPKHPLLSWTSGGSNVIYTLASYQCDVNQGDCAGRLYPRFVSSERSYVDFTVKVWSKSSGQAAQTAYYYAVSATDNFNQTSPYSNKVCVISGDGALLTKQSPLPLPGTPDAPTETKLCESFPNPFNPSTKVNYQLEAPGFVSIVIYNLLGEDVGLLENRWRDPGYYEVTWDGSKQPTGLYFLRISVADDGGKVIYSAVRRIALIK